MHTQQGLSPWFASGDCLVTLEWDAALPELQHAAVSRRPGAALRVAPLPGSRLVADRRAADRIVGAAASSSEGGSESGGGGPAAYGGSWPLVNCSVQLCSVSANHDLLYLQMDTVPSALLVQPLSSGNASQAAVAAAAAAAATGGTPPGGNATSGNIVQAVFTAREATLVSRLAARAAAAAAAQGTAAPTPQAALNRVPYSAAWVSMGVAGRL